MATPKLIALAAALSPLVEAFSPSAEASASPADHWVLPQGLPEGHNGGYSERLTAPAAGKQPHILMILFDDYGWADAGWHRGYTAPGGEHVPTTPEVATPNLDALVKAGIDLNRHYVYKYCSPSRSALQVRVRGRVRDRVRARARANPNPNPNPNPNGAAERAQPVPRQPAECGARHLQPR